MSFNGSARHPFKIQQKEEVGMCNIPKDEAIAVAKQCQTATNKKVVAAHRSLNNFIDQTQADKKDRIVFDREVQQAKRWRLDLKQEMHLRGIESSARPARQLAAA